MQLSQAIIGSNHTIFSHKEARNERVTPLFCTITAQFKKKGANHKWLTP
jgi:hypothetical protein